VRVVEELEENICQKIMMSVNRLMKRKYFSDNDFKDVIELLAYLKDNYNDLMVDKQLRLLGCRKNGNTKVNDKTLKISDKDKVIIYTIATKPFELPSPKGFGFSVHRQLLSVLKPRDLHYLHERKFPQFQRYFNVVYNI